MSLHGDHEGGAAKRRRDRRLRLHWRHEQLTLQMALAAALHHSRDVGPVTYNALRSQKTAGDTEFFSLYEEELGGTRPDRLYEVRPQERVQRRTVEQIVDNTLFLPTLDVPVPQMENELVEVCRLLDVFIPEQAIEVPKISSSRQSRRRRVRFAEQTAEQLVEVPTIVSYSSLHGLVEQNVDIPVPHGRDRVGGGLLGLLLGQSSTAFGGARFPAATAEQIVRDSRVLHPASSSSGLPGMANQGVFRTFPRWKKVRTWARTRGRNCSPSRAHPRRRLSWRISSRMQLVCGCAFQAVGGNFWAQIQKFGGLGEGWDGALVMRQSTVAFESISCPSCSRSSHLESGALFPCPCVWKSSFRASGCCFWLRKLDFSGDDFFRGGNAWYNSGFMLCVSTSRALEEFTHFLRGGGLDFEALLFHSV